jgi:hypothetical protein
VGVRSGGGWDGRGGWYVLREELCMQGLGSSTERKRNLPRPKTKWEDHVKMGLNEIERESPDCIHVTRKRKNEKGSSFGNLKCHSCYIFHHSVRNFLSRLLFASPEEICCM